MAKLQIGVQLYTLRDQTAKDMPAVLKALAEIGYAGAELAGFGNLKSAKEVKATFDDARLIISGAHVSFDRVKDHLDEVVEECKTLGHGNVIVPNVPGEYHSAEGFRKLGALLTESGKTLAKENITLAYHNHAQEFKKFDDVYGLDILWQHSDPKYLLAEVDLFWVKFGGADPLDYIQNHVGKRLRFMHLKDMNNDKDRKFAPVGEGIIDFRSVCTAAVDLGAQWGLVEQDDAYGQEPLEIVRTSYQNLKKLGIA